MVTICATQLIYTRVETNFSPTNKAGFQTFYKSNPLSSDDVAAIERRVQCFQPYDPAPLRRQFFMLNNGKAVVSSSTQIEAHPEITDKSKRKGAFIAHCLILDKNEFDSINRNPFAIFDNYQFITDAEDMVKKFKETGEDRSIERIELPQEIITPPCHWNGSEIRKLLLLATQAEEISKERKSVFLFGPESEINGTLRTIFHLIPLYQKTLCTFDTCIDGCSVQTGDFWAVGTTRQQGGSAYINVNTEAHRVTGRVQELSENEDFYWKWLNTITTDDSFESAIEIAPTVQILSTAFTEKSEFNLEELDEEACHNFFNLHRNRIVDNLKGAIERKVGRNLADLLSVHIQETIDPPVWLNIAASQSIDSSYLSSLATDYIFGQAPELTENDWKILQDFAEQDENPLLLFLSVVFRKKIDEKQRNKALRNMDAEDFRQVLKFLSHPVEPSLFVIPKFLPLLIEEMQLEEINDEQFIDLVKTIIGIDAAEHIAHLSNYVEELDNKTLLQLEKITKKYSKDIPHIFWAKMVERREELGKPNRIFGFLKR